MEQFPPSLNSNNALVHPLAFQAVFRELVQYLQGGNLISSLWADSINNWPRSQWEGSGVGTLPGGTEQHWALMCCSEWICSTAVWISRPRTSFHRSHTLLQHILCIKYLSGSKFISTGFLRDELVSRERRCWNHAESSLVESTLSWPWETDWFIYYQPAAEPQ